MRVWFYIWSSFHSGKTTPLQHQPESGITYKCSAIFPFPPGSPRSPSIHVCMQQAGVEDYWRRVCAAPQHLYPWLRHGGREEWKKGLLVTCSVTVIVIPPDILSSHLSPSSSLHPWGVFPSCFGSWNLLTRSPPASSNIFSVLHSLHCRSNVFKSLGADKK